jgi:ABC-2 type transport system permease protein
MTRTIIFAKRNSLEMLRDPLIYIFAIAFPVILIALFAAINGFAGGTTNMFEQATLVPGIIVFSYTFIMLAVSLLVASDKKSAFVVRLYTSPMKTRNFVLGYFLPCIVIGIAQLIVCVFCGFIVAVASGQQFFSFGKVLLLMLSSLPMLVMCIFLGIATGTALNDKASSAVTSILICASGILGGAWIPLDTMGGFETFCRVLPFYPTVYLGRVITGAEHTMGGVYEFDATAIIGLVTIFLYLAASIVLALVLFYKKSASDNR